MDRYKYIQTGLQKKYTGPWKSVSYSREIVITVNNYVVSLSFGTIQVGIDLFVITVISL